MGRRTNASEAIDSLLDVIVVAGVVGITLAAPNGISALEKSLNKFIGNSGSRKEARRIGRYLQQQKIVKLTDIGNGNYRVTLTKRGKTRSEKVRFDKLDIPKKGWDGKWRIFMFDIPEEHKSKRDFISKHLRIIGFKQLQKSVFIYPYPVDGFIELLYETFPETQRYTSYLVADEIDQHNAWVRQFKTILH